MEDELNEMIKIGCISVSIFVVLVICIWGFKHLPQKTTTFIQKGNCENLIADMRTLYR